MSISQSQAHHLINGYFESFNQGKFEKTAALFGETGKLNPPYEAPIVGRERIFSYLQKKAKGMVATPQEWTFHSEEGDRWRVDVQGKVQAIVFQVNVTWQFVVTDLSQIASARIKLVASPKELLNLRATKEQVTAA